MDKANDLDAELKLRLMERAESYRVRLLQLDSAGREQELNKISQELAQEEQAVQNCAYVVLECFRPAISSSAYKELTMLQETGQHRLSCDYETTRCARLVAKVVTRWSLRVVQHYRWDCQSRGYLDALWAAAQMYPNWHDAADHLNAVMIRRHVGITRKDLVNICDWQKNHSVKVHGHDVSNLESELALVEWWVSSRPEHLSFSTGAKVVNLAVSAQLTHLLAKDDFGVLVQEAYGRKRMRISVSDQCGMAKGRTEDSDSPVKRMRLSKDGTGSTDVAVHRPADQDESQVRIRHFETASYADTTSMSDMSSVLHEDSRLLHSTPATSIASSGSSTQDRAPHCMTLWPSDTELTENELCVIRTPHRFEDQQQEESPGEYVAARVKEVGGVEEEDSDQVDDREEVIVEVEDKDEVNEVEEVAEIEVGDRDETEETEEAGEVIEVEVDKRNRVEGVDDLDDVDDLDEANEADENDEEEEEEEEKRGENVVGIAAEWKRRSLNVQQQAQQKAKKTKKKRAETAHTTRRRVKHAVSKGNTNLPTDQGEEAEAPREPLCFPSSKIDTSCVDFRVGRLAMEHSAKYAHLAAEWDQEYRDVLVELCTATERRLAAFDEDTPQSEHLRGMLGYLQSFVFAKVGTDVESCDDCDVFVCHSEDMEMLCRRGVRFTCCVLIKDEPFNDVRMHSIDSYTHGLQTLFPDKDVEVQDNNIAHKGKNGQRRNPEMSVREVRAVREKMKTVSNAEVDSTKAVNLLDMYDTTDCSLPSFLHLPRFKLMPATSQSAPGKHGRRTLADCQRFNVIGLRGSFSPAHCDLWNGTWIRTLDGVKMWNVAVDTTESEVEEWRSSGRQKYWLPKKRVAIMLKKGDTLVMPPGVLVIHAPYTPTDCLLAGGMFWDFHASAQLFPNLAYIKKNSDWITNENPPKDAEWNDIIRRMQECCEAWDNEKTTMTDAE
ncbi:hypothetical protein LTS01_024592 [Friedmanniomyces endolithicus]|nr:hypothetical protein LTS01_024592 [Friedmanniomyces endolithicus]